MSPRAALITGANGGIGQALCAGFRDADWRVVGTDRADEAVVAGIDYLPADLARLCRDDPYRGEIMARITALLPDGALGVLVNNAALQVVGPAESLTAAQWHDTLDTNVVAPFLLVRDLLPALRAGAGSVVNIGSIHAHLTKPAFSAYATSKAAIAGLTRALAVELGGQVRINAIEPAAIATPMLLAGFAGNDSGFAALERYHPSGTIGTPDAVARAALFLAGDGSAFLNGVVMGLDGGIAARLHDPA